MTKFDPANSEHQQIIKEAVHNADQLGRGRLSACFFALDLYDIEADGRILSDYIFNTYVLNKP